MSFPVTVICVVLVVVLVSPWSAAQEAAGGKD